jgi:hypothetical protein
MSNDNDTAHNIVNTLGGGLHCRKIHETVYNCHYMYNLLPTFQRVAAM